MEVPEQLRVLLRPQNEAGLGKRASPSEQRSQGSGAVCPHWQRLSTGPRGLGGAGVPLAPCPRRVRLLPLLGYFKVKDFPTHPEPLGGAFQSNYIPGLKQMLIQSYFSC